MDVGDLLLSDYRIVKLHLTPTLYLKFTLKTHNFELAAWNYLS